MKAWFLFSGDRLLVFRMRGRDDLELWMAIGLGWVTDVIVKWLGLDTFVNHVQKVELSDEDVEFLGYVKHLYGRVHYSFWKKIYRLLEAGEKDEALRLMAAELVCRSLLEDDSGDGQARGAL